MKCIYDSIQSAGLSHVPVAWAEKSLRGDSIVSQPKNARTMSSDEQRRVCSFIFSPALSTGAVRWTLPSASPIGQSPGAQSKAALRSVAGRLARLFLVLPLPGGISWLLQLPQVRARDPSSPSA
jgi:hypothetical protein